MTGALHELFESSVALVGNQWNAENLSCVAACKGTVLFADDSRRPIQLLQSANLRRTCQVRLLRDGLAAAVRKTDISGLTKHIFFTCCHNDFSTWLHFLEISHHMDQQAFKDAVRLPSISFAVIDLTAPLPFFHASSNPFISESRKAWGLFSSRKAVQEFCQSLNIVFGLCRNPSLLQCGSEASCPYLQMAQCPGPCLDKITHQDYMRCVHQAIQAADGNGEDARRQFETDMRQAAADRKFELAQLYKQRIDGLSHLQEKTCRWTENLEQLRILHVDRGPKVQQEGQKRKQQQFIAWKVTHNRITEIGRFIQKQPEAWQELFLANWDNTSLPCVHLGPPQHFGLLSLLLFRTRPQGLWLNVSRSTPHPRFVLEQAVLQLEKNKEDAASDTTSSSIN